MATCTGTPTMTAHSWTVTKSIPQNCGIRPACARPSPPCSRPAASPRTTTRRS
jgi:hypothetical protein